MKKLSLLISLLYGTALLPGCASTTQSLNWTVEPFQRIQHAAYTPDGYYQLGRYYQGQNRLDLAAEAYRKALAVDSGFIEAHNGLGTVFALQGKYGPALAEFNTVIARTPDAAHVYNNIGYLNLLQGNFADAVAAYTKATALDPGNQKARNNLAVALARNGEMMRSSQAAANVAESPPAQPPADQHAAASKAVPQAPAAPAIAQVRGDIVPAAVNKPVDSDAPGEADKAQEASLPVQPAVLAQVPVQPSFAVLEKPDPAASPIVLISGRAQAGNEAATNLPSANSVAAPLTSASDAMSTAPSASRTQVPMASSESKQTSLKAVPSSAERPVAIPGERNFALEVSNGNGINRLAAKFGSILSTQGLPKAYLTNQKPFNQAHTVIRYRKGYLFEAARLGRLISGIHNPTYIVESTNLPARTDVKLVLGKDLYGKLKSINDASSMTLASR